MSWHNRAPVGRPARGLRARGGGDAERGIFRRADRRGLRRRTRGPPARRQGGAGHGASRGIGRAIALTFAREGGVVVVNYVTRQDEADRVVAEIQAGGGQALAIRADVSRGAEARALVEAAETRFGRIDVLVNNAGVFRQGRIGTATSLRWSALRLERLPSISVPKGSSFIVPWQDPWRGCHC
jgi:short chain dehydrogenase